MDDHEAAAGGSAGGLTRCVADDGRRISTRVRLVDAPHLVLQVAARECADAVAAFARTIESDAAD